MHLWHLHWDICWESPITHLCYVGASGNYYTAMHVSSKKPQMYGHTCLILLTLRAVRITKREMNGRVYSLRALSFEIWEMSCSPFLLEQFCTLETP